MRITDAIVAGAAAAVASGVPSTVEALVRGRDPLEATRAAGTLLLPREHRAGRLMVAAVPVHATLSVSWACVLAVALPRRGTVAAAVPAGLAIGVLDLVVIGRRIPAIRRLPLAPQLADHVAYAVTVAMVLRRRRRVAPAARG